MLSEKTFQRNGSTIQVKFFNYSDTQRSTQVSIDGDDLPAYRYERRPNGESEVFAFTNNGSHKLTDIQHRIDGSVTRTYAPRPDGKAGRYLREERRLDWSYKTSGDTSTTRTTYRPDGSIQEVDTISGNSHITHLYNAQGILTEKIEKTGFGLERTTAYNPDGSEKWTDRVDRPARKR